MELSADKREPPKKIHMGQVILKNGLQNDRSAFWIIHGKTIKTETKSEISFKASEKLKLKTNRYRKKRRTDSYRDDKTN